MWDEAAIIRQKGDKRGERQRLGRIQRLARGKNREKYAGCQVWFTPWERQRLESEEGASSRRQQPWETKIRADQQSTITPSISNLASTFFSHSLSIFLIFCLLCTCSSSLFSPLVPTAVLPVYFCHRAVRAQPVTHSHTLTYTVLCTDTYMPAHIHAFQASKYLHSVMLSLHKRPCFKLCHRALFRQLNVFLKGSCSERVRIFFPQRFGTKSFQSFCGKMRSSSAEANWSFTSLTLNQAGILQMNCPLGTSFSLCAVPLLLSWGQGVVLPEQMYPETSY